jgi:uncharacterized protein (DUF2336 family)
VRIFPVIGHSFLKDLNEAISRASAESRARALWHTTDILLERAYNEEQIWIFGEVIGRLADEIEQSARAELSHRIAHSNNAPPKVIKMLAFDHAIEVAGPILQFSPRLDSQSLIANIREMGQPHMLAISRRTAVPVEVTDELVTRGNRDVVQSVVANQGACFSDFGFLRMIKLAETDSVLAARVGSRSEIPPQMFRQLIAKVSHDVRRKLERERPELANEIRASVKEAAGKLYSRIAANTAEDLAARQVVTSRYESGRLNEKNIHSFALARKSDEITIGLSLLSALPDDLIASAFALNDRNMILVLSKALDYSWETAMSLLFLAAENHRIGANDLDGLKAEFERADVDASRGILKIYQARRREAAHAEKLHA